jgi:hypothetical protein
MRGLLGLASIVLTATLLVAFAPGARAQPAQQWIGRWVNAEEHTTLTITGSTLSLAWPGTIAPERYDWTERRFTKAEDLPRWGYLPGTYFALDQSTITAASLREAFEAAWGPRLVLDPGNQIAAARYAALRERLGRLHAASYRPLHRFCINDRRAKTDCMTPIRHEVMVADGSHLVLILIDPEAAETSNVLVFDRAPAK